MCQKIPQRSMLAKDTCSHSLIYTTNRVIFELQNRIMLTKGHIKFLQIINILNLIKGLNSYFIPVVTENFQLVTDVLVIALTQIKPDTKALESAGREQTRFNTNKIV